MGGCRGARGLLCAAVLCAIVLAANGVDAARPLLPAKINPALLQMSTSAKDSIIPAQAAEFVSDNPIVVDVSVGAVACSTETDPTGTAHVLASFPVTGKLTIPNGKSMLALMMLVYLNGVPGPSQNISPKTLDTEGDTLTSTFAFTRTYNLRKIPRILQQEVRKNIEACFARDGEQRYDFEVVCKTATISLSKFTCPELAEAMGETLSLDDGEDSEGGDASGSGSESSSSGSEASASASGSSSSASGSSSSASGSSSSASGSSSSASGSSAGASASASGPNPSAQGSAVSAAPSAGAGSRPSSKAAGKAS